MRFVDHQQVVILEQHDLVEWNGHFGCQFSVVVHPQRRLVRPRFGHVLAIFIHHVLRLHTREPGRAWDRCTRKSVMVAHGPVCSATQLGPTPSRTGRGRAAGWGIFLIVKIGLGARLVSVVRSLFERIPCASILRMLGNHILHARRIAHNNIPSPGAKTAMGVDRLHPLRQRGTLGLILR